MYIVTRRGDAFHVAFVDRLTGALGSGAAGRHVYDTESAAIAACTAGQPPLFIGCAPARAAGLTAPVRRGS